MIDIRTRFSEKDLGLTAFGLNQGRVSMQFCDLLSEALSDRGLQVGQMPAKRFGARFIIDVDLPVVPKGQTVSFATGVIALDAAYMAHASETLAAAINRWGHLSTDNWRDVKVKEMPKGLDSDLRIAPFLLDCLGAQLLVLRLENLANRLADALLPLLSQFRVPVTQVPPSRKDWPS